MGNTRGDRINSKAAERTSRKSELGETPEKPGKLISASEVGCTAGWWARSSEGVGSGVLQRPQRPATQVQLTYVQGLLREQYFSL